MPQDIVDGEIVTDAIVYIREKDAARLGRHRLQAGDIVYSRRGDVRRCAPVRAEQEGWLCGTGCLRVRPGDAAHAFYLGAYLNTRKVQDWVENHAVGLTMLNLNTTILTKVPVELPSRVDEQARITEMIAAQEATGMAAHDEKRRLSLLRRALLNELAETGQGAVTLGSIVEMETRQLAPGAAGSVTRYLGLEHLSSEKRDPVGHGWSSDVSSTKTPFAKDDILFGKLRPYLRKVSVAPFDGVASTEMLVLRPLDGIDNQWLYYRLSAPSLFHWIDRQSEGTRMPRVSPRRLAGLTVLTPNESSADLVAALSGVDDRIVSLERRARVHRNLRTALREQLLNGEIRV